MNNKGFTLIEIIIVIALLGTLSVVIGVNMTKSLDSQNEKTKKEYRQRLENAACIYVDHKNIDISSCTISSTSNNCKVSISSLISEGLIDKTISNPYSETKGKVESDTNIIRVYMDSNKVKNCEYMGGD